MVLVLLGTIIAGIITINLIDLDLVIWLIGRLNVLILDIAKFYRLKH